MLRNKEPELAENIDSSFEWFDLVFYRVIFVFGSRHLILVGTLFLSVDLPLYESWVVADAYKVTVFYGIGSDDEFFYNSIFVLGPKGDCLKVKSCGQNKEVDKIKASGATGT